MSKYKTNEIIAAVDIGTSKIVVLIAEINEEDQLKIIGMGIEKSVGLKKGVVINIEATVDSIHSAIRQAEELAGCEINTVFAGIAGNHVRSYDGHGFVRINEGEVSQSDIDGAIDASKAMKIPDEEHILHVLPKDFIIDGQDGISDPIGMSGVRLEADVHIVTVSKSAEENIIKSLERCNLEVQEIVLEPLASSLSVLSDDEKDLGVCLVDIGGGTADIAVFKDGQIVTTRVIPIGGDHVTKDIAHELRTPQDEAEELKLKYACTPEMLDKLQTIEIPSLGNRAPRRTDLMVLAKVVEQRYKELFEVIIAEIGKINFESLRAGVVLTGGTSQLHGCIKIAEKIFQTDVRLGSPRPMSGAFETIDSPIHSTGAGLLLYALNKYKINPLSLEQQKISQSFFEKVKSWFDSNL
jgi:cell division protein FtsA|tara:strand:+ start:2167 stop:3396 length:1230 start_codon:yes stop_codon:yes gene_type:complete